MGIKVLGISCITNLACRQQSLDETINHEEVMETGFVKIEKVSAVFKELLRRIVPQLVICH